MIDKVKKAEGVEIWLRNLVGENVGEGKPIFIGVCAAFFCFYLYFKCIIGVVRP
jgi:hypothetical protein